MNFTILTSQKANKKYVCDASYTLDDFIECCNITIDELKSINESDGLIHKGDKYIKIKGMVDGDWVTYRAIPFIFELYKKYNYTDE